MRLLVRITALAACAMMALSAAAQAQSSRLEKILADGVIRIGTTGDFNPMTVRDIASGDFQGFEIDAANKLAADLGVKAEFVVTEWKTMVAGVLAGNYDVVMSGTSVDMGRAKVVGYTIPYTFVGSVPMALKSAADRFTTWEDVNKPDVRVAVILGTVFEAQARASFPDATIITVEAPATGFAEVLAGRADVALTSNVDAAAIMQRFDAITTFGGEARARRPLAYIAAQDDLVLINTLNAWLQLNLANGYFAGLEEKWGL